MAKKSALSRIRHLIREAQNPNLAQIDRRDFLKKMAVTTLSLTAVNQFVAPSDAFSQVACAAPDDEVLILGAGAAGLAAAYRLKKAGIPFRIVEASSRVGGRIWTEGDYNSASQFVELGGELVDSNHLVLRALCRELTGRGFSAEIEDFAPGDVGLDDDVFLVNGTIYSHRQFVEGVRPLAHKLTAAYHELYVGGNPDTDNISYRTADPTSTDFKLKNARRFDQMTVRELLSQFANDVEGWILQLIDSAYLGEYGLETDRQSAINLLYLLNSEVGAAGEFSIYGSSDEISRVRGGNENLIRALTLAVTHCHQHDDRILLGHELTAMTQKSSGFKLTFACGRTLSASQVICTLPFSILQRVDGFLGLPLSPRKKLAIRELGMATHSKLFLSFASKSWREKDPRTGFVPGTHGVRPCRGSIFSNSASQMFWETSRMQPGRDGLLTNFLGGTAGLRAGESTVHSALRDLEMLYPEISSGFRPARRRQCMNWSTYPHARGSYACLLPGQWTTIWGATGEPELGNRLFFAGEHTSLQFQGFMEGAFESGTRAAEEVVSSRRHRPVQDHYAWAKKVLGT